MREPVYFYKSTVVRCKFNATMHTVLLVVHPGDLGLCYSHVTMKRRQFCIVMQLRGVVLLFIMQTKRTECMPRTLVMACENLRSGFLSLPDLGAGRLAVELTYPSVY